MSITRDTALTRVRRRTRDEVATYQYSDALLVDLLGAALREMETEIRQDDPAWLYTRSVVLGYTQALDVGTYEIYPLPTNCASVRYIERADLSTRPKIWEFSPRDASLGRFGLAGLVGRSTVSFDGGVTTSSLNGTGTVESVTIFGDRFQVLPAPSAAGPTYGVVYDRMLVLPEGTSEYIDIPAIFEESMILSTAIRALRTDGDPAAKTLAEQLYGNGAEVGDLARAKKAVSNRTRRDKVLQP